MSRVYEKLERLEEHLRSEPVKLVDLEWVPKFREPNRTRITTWPPIEDDDSPVRHDCNSAPPFTPEATPYSKKSLPLATHFSRNVVDFCDLVKVFFFDQEETCCESEGVRETRVKTFDGRSEVPRHPITRADLDVYTDLMCTTIPLSPPPSCKDLSWLSDEDCCSSFRRTRSYADQWDDLNRLIQSTEDEIPESCDSMWLMEHMPCDCDLLNF